MMVCDRRGENELEGKCTGTHDRHMPVLITCTWDFFAPHTA